MADPTFCTLADLEAREPDIQKLTPESGNFNLVLAEARKEIEDRLIIDIIIENLDKLGPTIKPRQLRPPAIFLSLAMIYRANFKDDESPYAKKSEDYHADYENILSKIKFLDLDTDEDGILEANEENTRRMFTRTMRRR